MRKCVDVDDQSPSSGGLSHSRSEPLSSRNVEAVFAVQDCVFGTQFNTYSVPLCSSSFL